MYRSTFVQTKLRQQHKCHISSLFSAVAAAEDWRREEKKPSHLSLIWPKSPEICFVWSSSYRSSPFLAPKSPPRLARPAPQYLSSSKLSIFTAPASLRVIVGERLPCLSGAKLSLYPLCPFIPPSLPMPPSSPHYPHPHPPTWLNSDRGVRRLRALLRKSLGSRGLSSRGEEWRRGREANSLSVSDR